MYLGIFLCIDMVIEFDFINNIHGSTRSVHYLEAYPPNYYEYFIEWHNWTLMFLNYDKKRRFWDNSQRKRKGLVTEVATIRKSVFQWTDYLYIIA